MQEPLIFGVHTKEDAKARSSINPMVNLFGKGPMGQPCRGCRHLIPADRIRRMTECRLKSNTKGMTKKHDASWPSCAKFER